MPLSSIANAFKTSALLKLGVEHLSSGESQQAADIFRLAIQQARPSSEAMMSDAYTGLTVALYQMGLEEDARKVMAELARRHPGSAMPFARWGNILRLIDRQEEAQEKFSQAQARAPKNSHLLITVGSLRRQVSEPQPPRLATNPSGIPSLSENCPRRAHTVNSLHEEGEGLFHQGRYHEAASCFYQALKHDPGHVPATSHYARCLLELGQIQQALQVFELVEKNVQDAPELLLTRSVARLAGRDFDGCLNDCQRLMTLTPDCHAAHNNRGLAHLVMGKLPEAQRDFEHASRLAPDVALVWINLSRALLAQGKVDDARSSLCRASSLDPHHPQVHAIHRQMNPADYAEPRAHALSGSSSLSHSSDSRQSELPSHWVPV